MFWLTLTNSSVRIPHIKAKGSFKNSCFQSFVVLYPRHFRCYSIVLTILTAPVCLDSSRSSYVCYEAIICIMHSIPLLVALHSVKGLLCCSSSRMQYPAGTLGQVYSRYTRGKCCSSVSYLVLLIITAGRC